MADHGINDHPSDSEGSNRRTFLGSASKGAMVAGLVGGYGAFAAIAGRFLYPSRTGDVLWQFVTDADSIKVGQAIRYRGPSGETINIARHSRNGDAGDFTALSSTCPHLGCQVRWEGQNNRFFCPCHNGVFDPTGIAVEGPPADAGQSLPQYELKVENGLLHIAVPPPRFASAATHGEVIESDECISGPGHDPCLDGGPPRDAPGGNA